MKEVQLEVADGVAVVTLDAPDRRNALTTAMAAEFRGVLDEVDARDDVGALVLTAVGRSFCAGADVQILLEAGKDPAAAAAYDGIGAVYDAFRRLGQVRVPTVAAVRGSAVGAGMNMLLAADLRVVADDARLICGLLKRGLHPGGGHFVLLSRLIGREAAAAMALFGEEVTGVRAAELGLAWAAVPSEDVEPRARELATRLAADPELARVAVANFRTETGPPQVSWDVATQFERPAQMWSMRRAVRPG